MIAVYSFWSKPFYVEGEKKYAGFNDIEMFYCSWILSVMGSKKRFEKVVLYTDAKGIQILEKLNLQFDEVHIVLDEMNHLHEGLWAVPKIFVYSLQNRPFLHVDYDIFWWEELPKAIKMVDLVCESSVPYSYYKRILDHFVKYGNDVPEAFIKASQSSWSVKFIPGACVYGGNDYEAIAYYAKECLKFVEANKTYFNNLYGSTDADINMSRANNLIEEFFAGLSSPDRHWTQLKVYDTRDSMYAHLLGPLKKRESDCENIKNLVKREFPDYYKNIQA